MNFKELLGKIKIVKRCSSIAEADAQYNKLSKIRWICLILSVPVPLIFAFIAGKIPFLRPIFASESLLMVMIGVPFMIFMFTQFLFLKNALIEKTRLIDITCPDCKSKYEFSTDVKYTFDDVSSSSQVSCGGTIYTSVYTKYKFNCTCHQCGKEKIFYSSFLCRNGSASAYGASSNGIDTEPLIEKYFS